ncbi:MAG: glycoside hydrolase family 16 protein [Fimbriimonadaceae bacterium]|nr:glycoside hydrolase family 16 protein [Fimbriimonadaceae bacterium]
MWATTLFLMTAMERPTMAEADDPKKGRTLVWADEFNRDGSPNWTKWQAEVGKIRNNELQDYTDKKSENVRIENGRLIIEARNESPASVTKPEEARITSASIETKETFTHVYVEVRAKVPTGRGTWPAIWMLGDSIRKPRGEGFITWPDCGELDIMEYVGYEPEMFYSNVHVKNYNHMLGNGKGGSIRIPRAWENFHVFAMDWRKDAVDFFVNGTKIQTYAKESADKGVWPFDDPQYLKLNLAIGGAWGGSRGVDLAILPARFEVDYVRIYK